MDQHCFIENTDSHDSDRNVVLETVESPATSSAVCAASSSDVHDKKTEEPEVIEMEVNEDDILYYLVDEDGCELGFAIMEDGREVEYYYFEEDERESAQAPQTALSSQEFEAVHEGSRLATESLNAIYKDGAKTATELKDTLEQVKGLGGLKESFDEVKSALDMKNFFKL